MLVFVKKYLPCMSCPILFSFCVISVALMFSLLPALLPYSFWPIAGVFGSLFHQISVYFLDVHAISVRRTRLWYFGFVFCSFGHLCGGLWVRDRFVAFRLFLVLSMSIYILLPSKIFTNDFHFLFYSKTYQSDFVPLQLSCLFSSLLLT